MDENEKKEMIKVYWSDIRSKVMKVESNFASIVDELEPDHRFPMYLAYYPYGAVIADSQNMYLPGRDNKVYSLVSSEISNEIKEHLGYGQKSLAMGIVLEKNLEVLIDFTSEACSIPWLVYQPGTFFPFARTLSRNNSKKYAPNNILTITSGARSVFMLPNIGCLVNHHNLQRDFGINASTPKSLYQHWQVFKEIVNSKIIQSPWRSCLLYFSEKWLDHLHNNKSWLKLKMYLHELAWSHFEYRRNNIYYNLAFSKIQQKRNLKPNPYLTDTAYHLFTTALGAAPGYSPACDENSLPLEALQQSYIQSYGMTKYNPTIMHPSIFNFEDKNDVIYYSMQNPSTFVFSPKSRKLSSTLFELHELDHIMKIIIDELAKENTMCSGTILSEVAKKVEFKYFHNEMDRHNIIKLSSDIAKDDSRFSHINKKIKVRNAKFAADAKFLRGCISIRSKI